MILNCFICILTGISCQSFTSSRWSTTQESQTDPDPGPHTYQHLYKATSVPVYLHTYIHTHTLQQKTKTKTILPFSLNFPLPQLANLRHSDVERRTNETTGLERYVSKSVVLKSLKYSNSISHPTHPLHSAVPPPPSSTCNFTRPCSIGLGPLFPFIPILQ